MNFKSHTPATLLSAAATGQKIWELDSDTDGEDDVLIGEKDEVIRDIWGHFDFDTIPEHWNLREVAVNEIQHLVSEYQDLLEAGEVTKPQY
jgi:hypothetical protein